MMSEVEREPERESLLSRKTTRIAIDSPRKMFNKGLQSRTSHIDLRLAGSRLSRAKSRAKPFDPEEDYCFDSSDGKLSSVYSYIRILQSQLLQSQCLL